MVLNSSSIWMLCFWHNVQNSLFVCHRVLVRMIAMVFIYKSDEKLTTTFKEWYASFLSHMTSLPCTLRGNGSYGSSASVASHFLSAGVGCPSAPLSSAIIFFADFVTARREGSYCNVQYFLLTRKRRSFT